MVNNVTLVGRLTRDPELRKTQAGKSVLKFNLAVNRPFNKEQADFVSCIAWEQKADFMANYITKGALISVVGRIETGSYEDASGKKVYTTDVVVDNVQALESQAQRNKGNDQPPYAEKEHDEPVLDITSDDLPF